MTLMLDDLMAEYPVDRERIEAHKDRTLAEVRAYRRRGLLDAPG